MRLPFYEKKAAPTIALGEDDIFLSYYLSRVLFINSSVNTSINRLAALVVVMSTIHASQALAGPPFMTDDPEPTEYLHHEVYLAFQQTRTVSGRVGTLPQLEFNYGAAPNLQLGINLPLAFNNPVNGSRQSGLGDIVVSAKYRFLQETETCPMVAVFPSVTTRTGNVDKGLGSGATKVFIPVWFQKAWGDWQSYGGGGYLIDQGAGANNHWFFGGQLQKEVFPWLTLGGEVFHSTEAAPGDGASSGFNLGGMYHFNEQNHLLFTAGKGLTNVAATNQFSSYIGYQWIW